MTTPPRRIPLNPCDICIHGHHRLCVGQERGGNIAFTIADLAGWIDPAVVLDALAAAMVAHPVTMSTVHLSPFRWRPYWRLPSSPARAAPIAARRAYVHDDLRSFDDAAAQLDRLCTERFAPDWEFSRGPQVRLEQYDLPGERTRLCLRWPHYLMDGIGAHYFLAEMERRRRPDPDAATRTATTADPSLLPDGQTVDILSALPRRERLRLIAAGLFDRRPHRRGRSSTRFDEATRSSPRFDSYQFLLRQWRGSDFDRIQAAARRTAPPGPGLYARHLAGAVIRALDRIYREERIETDAYLITFPMRVRAAAQMAAAGHVEAACPIAAPAAAPFPRPLHGNYVVTPTLCIDRSLASDPSELGAVVLEQIEHFLTQRKDLAQWALLQAVSLVHPLFSPLMFKLPIAGGSYSSGFSYYHAVEGRWSSLAGAEVLSIWGGGPTTTPPGWNPTFCRYRDQLQMSLTWTRPAIPDERARRYASYIEEFIFAAATIGPGGSST